MSWQAVKWAVQQVTGSAGRKALLLVLAEHADERGVCWPSQATIAKGVEQSIDTVQRQIRKLVELGLVNVTVRLQGRGRWPGRAYQLNMRFESAAHSLAVEPPSPTYREEPLQTAKEASRMSGSTPHHTAGSTVHRAANRNVTMPQAMRHKPSIEPSFEPSPKLSKLDAFARMKEFQRSREGLEVIQDRIARRIGDDGWLILGDMPPKELEKLTKLEEAGQLTYERLQQALLAARFKKLAQH